jgi:hypothetical protein
MELVDPNLGSEFNKEEAIRMIKVALLCTEGDICQFLPSKG